MTSRVSAIASFLLVLPFAILELVNGRALHGLPIPLFAMMWLLAFSFAYILTRMTSDPARTRRSLSTRFLGPLLLIMIAWAWVGLVVDQMPCFLGVPNCD